MKKSEKNKCYKAIVIILILAVILYSIPEGEYSIGNGTITVSVSEGEVQQNDLQ